MLIPVRGEWSPSATPFAIRDLGTVTWPCARRAAAHVDTLRLYSLKEECPRRVRWGHSAVPLRHGRRAMDYTAGRI